MAKYSTFTSTLEKESHNEDLKPSHRNHHHTLNNTEVEYPLLRAPYRAKIPILPRPEVLLIPTYRGQLAGKFHNRVFQGSRLFGAGALFGRKLRANLVFDL